MVEPGVDGALLAARPASTATSADEGGCAAGVTDSMLLPWVERVVRRLGGGGGGNWESGRWAGFSWFE
jgi:hypothetical protein